MICEDPFWVGICTILQIVTDAFYSTYSTQSDKLSYHSLCQPLATTLGTTQD